MNHNSHMKLKPSLFDKIFRKDRFKEVIYLRNQIKSMLDKFDALDIWDRIGKYRKEGDALTKFSFTTLNEVSMYNDLGEEAVIKRLKHDRNLIYNVLKGIPEIDLSDIQKSIREEKLNNVLC